MDKYMQQRKHSSHSQIAHVFTRKLAPLATKQLHFVDPLAWAQQQTLLLCHLAKLSQQARWIYLINPQGRLAVTQLREWNIDVSKFVVIATNKQHDLVEQTCRALRSGKASAVICWLPQSALAEQQKIAQNLRDIDCECFLFQTPKISLQLH